MYYGSLYLGDIISAFTSHVPDCYVRDYRANGGYITLCRGYRDIPWRDQLSTRKVERQVPNITLGSFPRGYVTSATIYAGLRLIRPGWRESFRKASRHLTQTQMEKITEELGVGEVFPGVS